MAVGAWLFTFSHTFSLFTWELKPAKLQKQTQISLLAGTFVQPRNIKIGNGE